MHIRQLPSGRYQVLVKHNGRRASGSARTLGEARQLGAELVLILGGRPADAKTSVAELLAGHMADVEPEWSPTTYADAQRVVKRLPDTFTARRVQEVSPAIIAGLYRQLRAEGWSAHRLRRLRMVLNGGWKRAIAYEWATTNPCRDVTIPKADKPEVAPPSDEQVRAVLAKCGGAVQLFVRLAVVTGSRRGELVALTWDDVDLERAELVIRRALVQVAGQPPVERSTKTGSKGFRVLTLDLPTVAALRRHRSAQVELALASGLPSPVWLFSHDAGLSPWRPDYISRAFGTARDAAGVTGVRLHDLRHYVAVTMLQDGESPADVAGQLGHASVATTTSTYWRHMPGRNRDATDRRAARLGE
jgi:integrase